MLKMQVTCVGILTAVAIGCATTKATRNISSNPHTIHSTETWVSVEDCQSSKGLSVNISAEQQNVINETMGSRAHRVQHALWHATRAGLSTKDIQSMVTAFGPLWNKSHALCPAPGGDASRASYNPAGEDFLY